MTLLIYILFFLLGMIFIIKGSDWFVDSAVWFARAFRIPQIIIGATLVSICTTLPETLVSVTAAAQGKTDMALGNALGSIAVNTAFIMGVLLLFTRVTVDNKKEFLQNGVFLIGSLILLQTIGMIFGQVNRFSGILLILIMILYILNNIRSARGLMDLDIQYDIEGDEALFDDTNAEDPEVEGVRYDEAENDFDISWQVMMRKIIFFLIGIALVVLGADLLVDYGVRIAEYVGVPTLLISLIFTSIGTSLPELGTIITAIRKKATNLGIGNIIGADILNIVQVIGVSAIVTPLSMTLNSSILRFQIPFVTTVCLLAICFGMFQQRTRRWNGVLLVFLYLIFLAVNFLRDATPLIGPLIF